MVTLQMRAIFFDDAKVLRAIGRAKRRAMIRGGALVRQIARRSIRKRKKTSAPGRPPSSHAGDLRNKIFFGYDPDTASTVIGPVKYAAGEAPNLLEFSGTVVRRLKSGRTRRLHYRARPCMAPALKVGTPKLPPMWRKSVRED